MTRTTPAKTISAPEAAGLVRSGDWLDYGAVLETDNLADIHLITTALAAFTFRLEPVIDVMDAVAVELRAMAWRESLG